MKTFFRAAGAALLLALSACGGTGTPTVTPLTAAQVSTAESNMANIAGALVLDAPAIAQLSGANSAQVSTAAQELQTALQQMSTATAGANNQQLVQTIEANVNVLVSAASAAQGVPANVQQDLAAVAVLLPVAETVLNVAYDIVESKSTASGGAPAAAAPLPGMTPSEAASRLAASADLSQWVGLGKF